MASKLSDTSSIKTWDPYLLPLRWGEVLVSALINRVEQK